MRVVICKAHQCKGTQDDLFEQQVLLRQLARDHLPAGPELAAVCQISSTTIDEVQDAAKASRLCMSQWGTYLQYAEAQAQVAGIHAFMHGEDWDSCVGPSQSEHVHLWVHCSKTFKKVLKTKRGSLSMYMAITVMDKCHPLGINCLSRGVRSLTQGWSVYFVLYHIIELSSFLYHLHL